MEIADIIEQLTNSDRFNDHIKKLIASETDRIRVAANERRDMNRRRLYGDGQQHHVALILDNGKDFSGYIRPETT